MQPIQLEAKCMFNEIPYVRSLSLYDLLDTTKMKHVLKQRIHNL